MPFSKPLRARSGGILLLLPPSESRTSSAALWTLTGFDSPGTFFSQKFNLSRPDRPAARLQESFQLRVRNMGTYCLNGNTAELRLPAMHYSASRPLSQADRKRSQMERFEDADRQGGRSEAQNHFYLQASGGRLLTIKRKISQTAETSQEVLSASGRRQHIFSCSLSTALLPFFRHSRTNESGFHKAAQQSISSQVGMIRSLLGLKAKTFNMKTLNKTKQNKKNCSPYDQK